MPYLISVLLIVVFLNHINWIKQLKNRDWVLMLIAIGLGLSLVNAKIACSGYGIVLNIISLFLILYMADKVRLHRACYFLISLVCLVCFLTWVGCGSRGYNENMAAMIILILAVGIMPGFALFVHGKRCEKAYPFFVILITVIAFAQAWELRARGILVGIVVIWLLTILIPGCVWGCKWRYRIFVAGLIGGSILIPVSYVWLWNRRALMFQMLGKSLYTGRQTVWEQFILAFIKEPWTGIGSDILRKIPNALLTEVHNGLLHVLVIYGVCIFAITALLLFLVFERARIIGMGALVSRQNAYLAVGLMVSSYFENYIVMPAFNIIFFLLLTSFFVKGQEGESGYGEEPHT